MSDKNYITLSELRTRSPSDFVEVNGVQLSLRVCMVMNSDETLPQTSSLFRTYHPYLEQQKELKKPLMYYKMQVGDVIQSLGEKFLKSAPAYTVKEIN